MSSKKRAQASSATAAAALSGKSTAVFGSSAFSKLTASSPLSYFANPPDTHSISDANLLVVLKNLLKKDDTTKEKALNDLMEWTSQQSTIEDAVVTFYVHLYPRFSIENSLRIRQLSHKILGIIGEKTHIAFAPYLPQVVGSWLAGIYDSDKTVSAAAAEGLRLTFSTDEKISRVWRTYQGAILDFCGNVKANEQLHTLSDERNNRPDEMEARFARVMSGCVMAVAHLVSAMAKLDEQEQKYNEAYRSFVNEPRLWTFAYHADAYLRQAVYSLLRTCLVHRKDYIDPAINTISSAMIEKAMMRSQVGSNQAYLDTLIYLTEAFPESLDIAISTKRPLPTLLRKYVSKGSQGAPATFWTKFATLIQSLPGKILPSTQSGIQDLLNAILQGLGGNTEPKDQRTLAAQWQCFFQICVFCLQHSSLDENTKAEIVAVDIGNTFSEYLEQDDIRSLWRIGSRAPSILTQGLQSFVGIDDVFIRTKLGELFDRLAEQLKTALGSVSTSGQASEKRKDSMMLEEWTRLTSTVHSIIKGPNWVTDTIDKVEHELFLSAISRSKSSKGGNVVATFFVSVIARDTAQNLRKDDISRNALREYLTDNASTILASPSRSHFLSTLLSYQQKWVQSSDSNALEEAIDLMVISENRESILLLFDEYTESRSSISVASSNLDAYVRQECRKVINDFEASGWKIVSATCQAPNSLISKETKAVVLTEMISKLRSFVDLRIFEEEMRDRLLKEISHLSPTILIDLDLKSRRDLLVSLLVISETTNDVTQTQVNNVFSHLYLGKASLGKEYENIQLESVVMLSDLVLEQINGEFVSIRLLTSKVLQTLSKSTDARKSKILQSISFTKNTWEEHMRPFSQIPPDPSLNLIKPLGECVFLVQPVDVSTETGPDDSDSDGLNKVMRMALFFISIMAGQEVTASHEPSSGRPVDINESDFKNALRCISSEHQRAFLMQNLILGEVVSDKISIPDEQPTGSLPSLLQNLHGNLEAMRLITLSSCQSLDWHLFEANDSQDSKGIVEDVIHDMEGTIMKEPSSCKSYYAARALQSFVSDLRLKNLDSHGAAVWVEKLGIGKKGHEHLLLRDAALLSGLRHDEFTVLPNVVQLRNRLVSDISGIKPEDAINQAFPKLLLLNEIWTSEMVETPSDIPQQRALYLIRAALKWFKEEVPVETIGLQDPGFLCSVIRMFYHVIPVLRTVQGSHWEDLFNLLDNAFQVVSDSLGATLAILLSALRLFEKLSEIKAINAEDEAMNDDFNDQWDWYLPRFYRSWLILLTDITEPLHNEAFKEYTSSLSRVLMKLPTHYLEDPAKIGPKPGVSQNNTEDTTDSRPTAEQLYHLMSGDTDDVQGVTFNLLHRRIPLLQEQVSIDVALSRDETYEVQLPLELLSLLLEKPKFDYLEAPHLEIDELLRIRGYLLSWVLVFDHFVNSSFRVKASYQDSLKSGGHVDTLLDYIFDFLGHSRGKPIDGNKYSVSGFDPIRSGYGSPDLHYIRTLMVHVYYLSLRFTPSISKQWYSNNGNRQIKDYVQQFTDKFLSPLLVDIELREVERWLENSEEHPEGLGVKISRNVREVTVTYEVDEQTMEMMVKLPASFPLQLVDVKGIKRVAVSEGQWKTWLLACQAVIALQGGSIVDGLTLFQKNVKLHLDGVEECAICYSILSTVERTLPSKGCGTCKRKFHGSCLMRWFKSSSSSSCPLCRSSFQFV